MLCAIAKNYKTGSSTSPPCASPEGEGFQPSRMGTLITRFSVPALRASILFVISDHALTRVAAYCRRVAPGFFAIRSEHVSANNSQTSLEEAAVHRPGRKAVYGNSDVKT